MFLNSLKISHRATKKGVTRTMTKECTCGAIIGTFDTFLEGLILPMFCKDCPSTETEKEESDNENSEN